MARRLAWSARRPCRSASRATSSRACPWLARRVTRANWPPIAPATPCGSGRTAPIGRARTAWAIFARARCAMPPATARAATAAACPTLRTSVRTHGDYAMDSGKDKCLTCHKSSDVLRGVPQDRDAAPGGLPPEALEYRGIAGGPRCARRAIRLRTASRATRSTYIPVARSRPSAVTGRASGDVRDSRRSRSAGVGRALRLADRQTYASGGIEAVVRDHGLVLATGVLALVVLLLLAVVVFMPSRAQGGRETQGAGHAASGGLERRRRQTAESHSSTRSRSPACAESSKAAPGNGGVCRSCGA